MHNLGTLVYLHERDVCIQLPQHLIIVLKNTFAQT
jgi:hypothetical protein